MKLAQLLADLKATSHFVSTKGPLNLQEEVKNLTSDTREVSTQTLFTAIQGTSRDGHEFLADAVQKGASILVVEKTEKVPSAFSGLVIQVRDSRSALDTLAASFYAHPSKELFCVGVTGTNGKTSTTYMLEALLNHAQIPTGVMGTINHHLLAKVWESSMTTPDPVALQKRLREFLDSGAKAAAMEVSSHALDQKRADSVDFDVAIYTNLTRDHLDYHQTMENYLAAKQRLFLDLFEKSKKTNKAAFLNADDSYAEQIKIHSSAKKFRIGQSSTSPRADLIFEIKKLGIVSTDFEVQTPWGRGLIQLPMSGLHNVYNAMGALGAALFHGVTLENSAQAFLKFRGVPGRLQLVPNSKNIGIFVDYAHTPDALENVLKSMHEVRKEQGSKGQVITIFGCGGDRDKGKRPLMAQTTEQWSDFAILTSDNPRTEDPHAILKDVEAGFSSAYRKSKVLVEVDRKKAIIHAIKNAKPNDLILIAGKGHEDYQIIGTQKNHFSDYETALEALA